MVEIYDAHEQGEIVKKWLRENGSAIVMGLVIAFGGLFGFKQWQAWQASSKQQAYAEFEALTGSLTEGQLDAAMDNFQSLEDKFGKSPYATLAALQMGRARLEAKQPDLAVMHYRFVLEKGRPKALRAIARERLARTLLSMDRAGEALEIIEAEPGSDGLEAHYAETRGDILLALERNEEAIVSYQQALDTLEAGMGDRETLVLKLEALGVVPDEAAPAS